MTKLPNAHASVVQDTKVRDYLLCGGHPHNRGKAQFLEGFGFTRTAYAKLVQALRMHPVVNAAVRNETSAHGAKYVLECALDSPDGRNPCVRSVWMIDAGGVVPRLVTAYPKAA